MTPEEERMVAILRYLEDWDKLTRSPVTNVQDYRAGLAALQNEVQDIPDIKLNLIGGDGDAVWMEVPRLAKEAPPYLLRACCHGSYLRTILLTNLVTETPSSFLVRTIRKRVKRLNSMIKRTFNNHSMSIFANSGAHGRTMSKSGGVGRKHVVASATDYTRSPD